MTDFDRIRRRRYVAIGTGEFEEAETYPPLPGVAEELKIVTGWLTDEQLGKRRFTQESSKLAKNPKLEDIERHLRRPDPPWNTADAAAIYITGHGYVSHEGGRPAHCVILKETDPDDLSATALSTADLLGWFANKDVEHLLVIVDVCFAGQVSEELGRRAKKDWLILPSALKNQTAEQGVLAKAIERYIKDAEKLNKNYPYLQVGQFVDGLNARLPLSQQVTPVYKGKNDQPHVSLPNPSYDPRYELVRTQPARRDMALLASVLTIHNRVDGALPSDGSPGWLFASRRRLMADMIAATETTGATMVTGSAGSGKSMALSRLVTLSDPEFCDHYADEVAGVPRELMPRPGAVKVAVTAQGLAAWEIADQICSHLGTAGRSGTGADPVKTSLDALSDFLAKHTEQLTIVLDALDEAVRAPEVVTSFLRPLLERHPARVCLLIGVRSTGGRDGGSQADGAKGGVLAALLVNELEARTIRADDDDPRYLTEFVRNILVNTPDSPYRDAATEEIGQVAEVVSNFAGRSYLTAGVAASSVAGRPARVSPDDRAWLDELSRGFFGVFQGDLQKSFDDPKHWRRGVALLRAVAFAQGTGLPWDRIWPQVATAVDSVDADGKSYGDEDVKWLLESRLSAYLVTGDEDGLTVYRLLHDELRGILRDQWRELLERREPSLRVGAPPAALAIPPREEDTQETRLVEGRIARKLGDRVREELDDAQSVDTVGVPLPPYIRRHLVEHALAGGDLDRYLPTPFVPYLDIARLAAAVNRLPDRRQLDELVAWLPVVRRVTHLWDWNRPARNAAAMEMWAALGDVMLRDPVGGSWHVCWAAQPLDMSTVLGRQQALVRAVVTANLPGGPVAVTGGGDGLLYTWDLSTSGPYREPINTGGSQIVSIAAARLSDEVTVAVTGSEDGMIRFWNLATGHPVGDLLDGGGGRIRAVATARLPDDRIVVIASDVAGTIRTWDLVSRESVGEPVRCGRGMALGLTTTRVDGQVLGLATGEDSGLQVWDVATGRKDGPRLAHPLARLPWTNTLQGERAIAAEVLNGVEVAIIGGGDRLLLWDLRKREAMTTPEVTGGDGKIRSLATTRWGDRVVAVTGASSAVQVFDLETGEAVGDLMRGHDGSVEAVSIARMADGSLLAISGSRDASVRIWDVPGRGLAAQGMSRHVGIVEDVATVQSSDGRAIVFTCSDAAIGVWELERGRELAQLKRHESPVISVAAAQAVNGVLVVAGHWDGTVSAWRAADGVQVASGQLSERKAATTALAMATLAGGRLIAVAGGWDGSVQAWDPLAGVRVGAPLGRHARMVASVATATTADGRVLAISGGEDGQVLIRDLGAHLDPDGPRPQMAAVSIGRPVTSLATGAMPDGQPCLIVGGADGIVRVLDLLADTPVRRSWQACTGPVTAVTMGRLPGGESGERLVVFTGGEDALVQAWDPATGWPIGEALPVAGPIRAMAFQAETSSLVVGGLGVAVTRLRHGSANGNGSAS